MNSLLKSNFEKITISHVLLTSLVLHVLVITHSQIYQIHDETIFTAMLRYFMIGEDHSAFQLPGLNFFVSPFVLVFGDSWFSWRIPILGFNLIALYFFYKILLRFTTKNTAIFATLILSFDAVFFVHSSLMLRDVPVIAFGLMAIYLYFSKRYYLMAICIGFSALIKETALFFLLFLVMYHIVTHFSSNENRKKFKNMMSSWIKSSIIIGTIIAISFLIPLAIYDATITVYEYEEFRPLFFDEVSGQNEILYVHVQYYFESIGKKIEGYDPIGTISNPIDHLRIFFTKGYYGDETKAGDNFFNSVIPFRDSPDTYYGIVEGGVTQKFDEKNITLHISKVYPTSWDAISSANAWWYVGFWGSVLFLCYSVIKHKLTKDKIFVLSGLVTMFLPYLYIAFIRDTWEYYFIYTIPFIAFGLSLLFNQLQNQKIRFTTKFALLVAVFVSFVYYFPVRLLGEIQIPPL